jgi:hypothetical protein
MRIAEYVLKAAIALRMPLASDDQPDDREEPRERGAPTQVVSSSP